MTDIILLLASALSSDLPLAEGFLWGFRNGFFFAYIAINYSVR